MKVLWKLLKYTASFFMLVGLVFASGVFSVLLYGKITGKEWAITYRVADAAPLTSAPSAQPVPEPTPAPKAPERKSSVMLDAPVFRQHPELPSGCEITSLSMLLHYAGVAKTKMDLLPDMKRDTTPIQRAGDGTILFWGNPNRGFVGDITGKSKGFGIYHAALLDLLKKYVPSGLDLTRSSYERLEEQLSAGVPVLVWTTIDYRVPSSWTVWDTPDGPIQTTFMEHAVLLVGYDEESVYVNDPWTGKAKYKVNKAQFVETWEAMGRQAITYKSQNG
ncbi:C39 family peptidase [Gorillibacterium sp. sgz5001074]|uniref:C39 family peptidase n=1 Tax=Gorillibacterium sp. sgz5001074 TaxID=3446695 RepID=UPI003F665250